MAREQLLKKDGNPLYVRVANRLKDWIQDGTYLPGTKVPSVRDLSDKLDVSISTILQSYDLLENQGYIEAKPQSGYYVKMRTLTQEPSMSRPASAPRFVQSQDAFLDVIRSCGDPDLVPLGGAVIHNSLLPVESLQRSLGRVARENPDASIRYDRALGFWGLRRELARRSVDMGFEADPKRIVTTTGAMEAINLALKAVTKAGDVVAVESPTYYGILHSLESMGLKVLELPTCTQTGIDVEVFEEKVKKFSVKAALLTPNFQNPLGSLMTDEDKERVVQICSRHGVALIEDDIYGELQFQGRRPLALKSFDKKDEVIFCSSFSKTLAPGYRVGWLVSPKKWTELFERLKFSSTVATNSVSQMAIADLLEHHNYDRHLRKLRQTLAQNVHLTSHLIQQHFPKGTKVTVPQGGCLLWVEFPNSVKSLELHQKALKEGISIIPGPLFSGSGKYQNCIRLNCGNPWDSRIEMSLLKIAKFAEQMT
ncbi:MAG: PLP-dependent aminotransferase family protein [Pseudobdellovibrionaceae bacterium]